MRPGASTGTPGTGPCSSASGWRPSALRRCCRLLQVNPSSVQGPQCAELWTLAELLARQPAKFGKLLRERPEARVNDTRPNEGFYAGLGRIDLATIEKVYGWDEKQLAEEWRAYVMGQK